MQKRIRIQKDASDGMHSAKKAENAGRVAKAGVENRRLKSATKFDQSDADGT
jgi:hypothetical protein